MRKILGYHWIVEFTGCDPAALARVEDLRPVLEAAVTKCGATPLEYAFHQFEPRGVSGIVLIAESHLSFHTWPEEGYMGLDIFTCGTAMDPGTAVEVVAAAVRPRDTRVTRLDRGIA